MYCVFFVFHSSMRYRDYAPVNEKTFSTKYGEFIMFFAYWWFFHNLFYDPAHIYGDGMPDPRDWTGMLTSTLFLQPRSGYS